MTVTTTETNRQIRLKKRPVGMPTPGDFGAVASPRPAPRDGEVLRRTIYLSLDPYMRGRMSDAASYANPVNLGDVMVTTIASRRSCRRWCRSSVTDESSTARTSSTVSPPRRGRSSVCFEGRNFGKALVRVSPEDPGTR